MARALKDVAYDYWCCVMALLKFRFEFGIDMVLYGLNQKRIELHNELCAAAGATREATEQLTDNLDKYRNFEEFLKALESLGGRDEKHDN